MIVGGSASGYTFGYKRPNKGKVTLISMDPKNKPVPSYVQAMVADYPMAVLNPVGGTVKEGKFRMQWFCNLSTHSFFRQCSRRLRRLRRC